MMKANNLIEAFIIFYAVLLNKLIRSLYVFTLESTHYFIGCHCCMTFHLVVGLFLARLSKNFSTALSLHLNLESCNLKNCTGEKAKTTNTWEIINLDQPKHVLIIILTSLKVTCFNYSYK
jgi:hypothetical protein